VEIARAAAGRHRIAWPSPGEPLVALEPSPAEVEAHAEALAAGYNDPHNRAMMAHSATMSAAEVVEHYASLAAAGGRPFLLFEGEALAGDADLRRIEGGRAELAILVAARAAQGRGLGTRFGIMLHGFAFRALGLDRVYVTIVPANAASRRLFEKLGYQPDTSPAARAYADEDTDVSMSLARVDFERAHPLPGLRIEAR
jgi:RimJ/RimL family protein N-acetyltransferase